MIHFDCPAEQQEYASWTYAHPKGAVLTKAGSRFRLHPNVFCGHIFDILAPGHIADGGRWCFDTEQEALVYARRESQQLPLHCEGLDCEG